MSDLHTDGNGVAGLLSEFLAIETTSVRRLCQSCGDDQPLGEHRAYHGAGVVLRCPSCGAVAVRIGVLGERRAVAWSGTFRF
jgi:predicted RNA-binding Zn-ribbon protein involved in translation (DUF1610 family)